MSGRDRSAAIKAYDVRGVVPEEFDVELAEQIGAAFANVTGAALSLGGPGAIVIGRDMRPSGPELVGAFARGALSQGVDVFDIGLASTDMLYFASGRLGLPGAMFTASHNPARYNGIKMCHAGAVPVGQDSGLATIREQVASGQVPRGAGRPGRRTSIELLAEYADHLLSLAPIQGIRPLKVVVDAGNGMAGLTVPATLTEASLTVVPMYFDLDGTFPNHEANPIDPANLRDLQARVLAEGADVGLAFDGDADRCFVIDERGLPVSPSVLTALIAERELALHPGATILHNLITSRAVPELVSSLGGTPIRTRVGHSFIKAQMASTGAVFGGEHSGHFYFAEFWNADSGMLAALHLLAALGASPPGTALSDLVAPYVAYATSGEINSAVRDPAAALERVRAAFEGEPAAELDDLDGLTVSTPHWWFNVRPSNTEPMLRLNIEAETPAEVARLGEDVLAIIREE